MQKFSILTAPLALLIFIGMCFYFINYDREAWREYQERKADLAVNYATDAAIDALIEFTADLGTDYADFERIKVDPEVALDMFVTIYLRNWKMADTKENRTAIRVNNLPCFVVAGYDGYYIGQPTVINSSGARDIVFEAKKPYLAKLDDGLYGLNLSRDDARRYDGNKISKISPVPMPKIEQTERITTLITDEVTRVIYNQKEGDVVSSFYVPASLTSLTRTNPISNVTVLAYVDNIYVGGGDPIEVFGIGGARSAHVDFVGGYIRDGYKRYGPMKNIPGDVYVIEVFENPTFAALDGYYYDPLYWE